MKRIVIFLFLLSVTLAGISQNKMFGNGGWNVNGKVMMFINGSDTLMKVTADSVIILKPNRTVVTFNSIAPTQTGNATKVLTTDGTNASWGPIVVSGTYTPTLTNGANVTSSTAFQCQYMRVGNVVTVSGKFELDPTLISTATTIGVSLPVASNFAAVENCGGTGGIGIIMATGADVANDRATFSGIAGGSLGSFSVFFTFTYLII